MQGSDAFVAVGVEVGYENQNGSIKNFRHGIRKQIASKGQEGFFSVAFAAVYSAE